MATYKGQRVHGSMDAFVGVVELRTEKTNRRYVVVGATRETVACWMLEVLSERPGFMIQHPQKATVLDCEEGFVVPSAPNSQLINLGVH